MRRPAVENRLNSRGVLLRYLEDRDLHDVGLIAIRDAKEMPVLARFKHTHDDGWQNSQMASHFLGVAMRLHAGIGDRQFVACMFEYEGRIACSVQPAGNACDHTWIRAADVTNLIFAQGEGRKTKKQEQERNSKDPQAAPPQVTSAA